MATIDVHIGNQKYSIKSDGDKSHLESVAHKLQDKIESLREEYPSMTATKVALLAAVEFASQTLQSQAQVEDYRASLLSKASDILERIERELAPASSECRN